MKVYVISTELLLCILSLRGARKKKIYRYIREKYFNYADQTFEIRYSIYRFKKQNIENILKHKILKNNKLRLRIHVSFSP